MIKSVTKTEVSVKVVGEHYAKLVLYLDEMITPSGQACPPAPLPHIHKTSTHDAPTRESNTVTTQGMGGVSGGYRLGFRWGKTA
jgi:hypothetical protein